MNELIRMDGASEFPVSGRELHERLGIETPYHKWFPRMCEYGFEDGKDFQRVSDKIVQNPLGGRPTTDHQLTLSMAKELCMIQRTEQGREVPAVPDSGGGGVEQPDAIMARALTIANDPPGEGADGAGAEAGGQQQRADGADPDHAAQGGIL